MKYNIALIALMFAIPMVSQAATQSKEYELGMQQIAASEKKLATAVYAKKTDFESTDKSLDLYNKIITETRAKYGSKVNPKLWTALSLGHNKRVELCRTPDLDAGTAVVLYPFDDCKMAAVRDFAITTLKIHLAR